ncbi:hypothetical protein E1293_08180 [Actinomadura darangshiensis]|uniref:Uncharacterized protein n=1 Tax=Actinomadura darangshiensis TaxID=705336 RepID=A0A4R5BT83_9ACTN|nr:hypothetical protein [Actinomadura darangshiensis]TDD87372.1 hypothetical protein E1293_08180 [Actinomadura darangshiensis]
MTHTYLRSQRPAVNHLADGLRRYAQGTCGELAAVELLIVHRFWLTRADFRSQFIERDVAPDVRADVLAWVKWDRAAAALACGRLVCSAGEAAVLQVAAALATGGAFSASALSSLDRENFARVLTATVQASGHSAAQVVIR